MIYRRILVCGGRTYGVPEDKTKEALEQAKRERDHLKRTLDKMTIDEGDMLPRNGTVIIHGKARKGADLWADEWAVVNWAGLEEYPADWDGHRTNDDPKGRKAGPIRNADMLAKGKPDVVLAFPGGRGTANMVALARAQGVPVIEISPCDI